MAKSKGNKDIVGIWSQIHFAETIDDNSLWLEFRLKKRLPKTTQKSRKKKNIVIESKPLF